MGSKEFDCKGELKFNKDIENLTKYIQPIEKSKDYEECIKRYAKKVVDKLILIKDILEEVLNPDIGSLAILYEIKGIQYDFEKIWKIYKKTIKLLRLYDKSLVLEDLDSYMKFLYEANKVIDELVKISIEILDKKIDFWKRNIRYKIPREYLG